jgi:hypothetical protein
LDRRNDVGTRGEVENPLDPLHGTGDCSGIGDVAFDDFKPGLVRVLREICAPAHDQAVEHTDRPALAQQPIDKVTSDEARTTGDQITGCSPHHHLIPPLFSPL